MINIRVLVLLVLCFLSMTPSYIIANEKPLKIVTEYLKPYQIKNEDGSLGGYGTDIVQALLALTNKKADIAVLPWARAYRIALNEPNVLIFSIARTPHRENLFQWIGTIKSHQIYMWGLTSKFKEKFNSIEHAKQYRISVSKNYTSAIFLQQQKFPYLFFTTRHTQNVGMLLKGRADIILSSEFDLSNIVKAESYSLAKFKKLKEVKALSNNLSIAFSKNSDEQLVNHFRRAFKELKDSGELDKIKKKWNIIDR